MVHPFWPSAFPSWPPAESGNMSGTRGSGKARGKAIGQVGPVARRWPEGGQKMTKAAHT